MKESMYVVTGASGHVGKRIAERLLAGGKRVRVIGRSADRLKGLADDGAEPVVGSVEDAAALEQAFRHATAVFLMIPPNPGSDDFRAWQKKIGETYAAAVREARVPYAVTLSSIGASLDSGTGPILGLHLLEEALKAVPGLNAVHLRPAFFMENHLYGIPVIRAAGQMISDIRPDLPMPMIATRDIADAAAQVLLRLGFQSHSTRELLGPRDLTMEEATRALGQAIGKPDLRYIQAPYEAAQKAMTDMGMSASVDAQPPLALRPPGYECACPHPYAKRCRRVGRPPAPGRKTDLAARSFAFFTACRLRFSRMGWGKEFPQRRTIAGGIALWKRSCGWLPGRTA